MNQVIDLEKQSQLIESLPKESYEDFILWLCMNFIDEPSITEVMQHPLFMTIDEYWNWVCSYDDVKIVIDTLIKPLRGTVEV
jgi:hypothetical protein